MEQAKQAAGKEWAELTNKLLEVQTTWKSIGYASLKDNERIWKDFREACNLFCNAKRDHFTQIKEQYKAGLEAKKALVDQALKLKDSTEWKQAADKLKTLQQQWKESAFAGPRDDHKLWMRFREACDGFFAKRKEHFAEKDAAQDLNKKQKDELLAKEKPHKRFTS